MRQGATENAQVCAALLEDLRERGLDTGRPTLFVLDGAKALHAAVTRVWGKSAVIQRCQVHKMRNLKAHVSEKHWPELVRRLSEPYHETDYATAKASLEGTARWLDRLNADAAASLREGLEETLTVVRLGVPGALRRTLATTNPIESALSVTRRVTARVTRRRDGDMRKRWCVAGLLRAESKFRRVKGHQAVPALMKVLEEYARARPAGIERGVVSEWLAESPRIVTTTGRLLAPRDRGPDLSVVPGSRLWPIHAARTPRGPTIPRPAPRGGECFAPGALLASPYRVVTALGKMGWASSAAAGRPIGSFGD